MELAILVARIAAVLFLTVGIAGILNKNYYEKLVKDIFKNPGNALTLGTLTLIIGMVLVSYHNIWTGWQILVTLIGWIGLIKGITIIVFPGKIENLSLSIMSSLGKAMPVVTIIIGLVFGYFGFL